MHCSFHTTKPPRSFRNAAVCECVSLFNEREFLELAAAVTVVVMAAAACGCFLLRELGDEALGGEEQSADGCCVLQRAARDLCRVNDAGFHEVNPFAGGNV